MAPNYLTEEYSGRVQSCPKEDGMKQNTCFVRMQVAPFHQDEPGLRIYYAYKNSVSENYIANLIRIFRSLILKCKNKIISRVAQ